jgi:RNA polymerase sigma-70 factor (sigma-E family)
MTAVARLIVVDADDELPATVVVEPAATIDLHTLYDAHWRYLVRLAVLLVDDVHSAEDVVQDAFVALHRRAGALRDPDAALAYLRTSVLNLSRSVIRRRQVARKHLKVAEPDDAPAADQAVLLRDEHRAALRAVRALPRHQREVLILRYWSGLSEREIAAMLGITPGSVKSAASRGMAALHKKLAETHGAGGER